MNNYKAGMTENVIFFYLIHSNERTSKMVNEQVRHADVISLVKILLWFVFRRGGGQAEECATNSREAKKVSE